MWVSRLTVGGHLTALRRTRVGRFGLDKARTLDDLAERPQLSFSLDEACLMFSRTVTRAMSKADAAANGRARIRPASTASTPRTPVDGRVIGLLRDEGSRTKSVVVIRPATL